MLRRKRLFCEVWMCILVLWDRHFRVLGHARLWEPPARSTMWRRGFSTPQNANDNELNCGGFVNHWFLFQGRCGICGDSYQQWPRENEAGGRYATGTISRTYRQGSIIDVQVDITANHLGYFEFHICPLSNSGRRLTQQCLDRHFLPVLQEADGRYYVGAHDNGLTSVKLELPADLLCRHCVLQWKYHTGQRWNCDSAGKCGSGLGPQEEFYGCSDVAVIGGFNLISNSKISKKHHVENNILGDINNSDIPQPGIPWNRLITNRRQKHIFHLAPGINWEVDDELIDTDDISLQEWTIMRNKNQPIWDISNNFRLSKSVSVRDNGPWHHQSSLTLRDKHHRTQSSYVHEPVVSNDRITELSRSNTLLNAHVPDSIRTLSDNSRSSKSELKLDLAVLACRGVKSFAHVSGMTSWCRDNCPFGFCPRDMCDCDRDNGAILSSDRDEDELDK